MIEETTESGSAQLKIKVKNPCICFNQIENNQWNYIEYKKVSDGLIFENIKGKYKLHIFELKKTMQSAHWQKTKQQWGGSLLYALLISGLLGIKIDINNIQLYIGYRNDKINEQKETNPVEIRIALDRPKETIAFKEWKEEKVTLKLFKDITCSYIKIRLNEIDGKGVYNL